MMLWPFKTQKNIALKNFVMEHPHNQWIKNEFHLKRILDMFFDSIPITMAQNLMRRNRPIVFIKSNGQLASAISTNEKLEFIVLYPDLEKLLNSGSWSHGLAVIAHELGHLYYQHSKRQIHTLKAQFEADYFTCQLGLGEELMAVIFDYMEEGPVDAKKRLERLKMLLDK